MGYNYDKQPYVEVKDINGIHSWDGYIDIVRELNEGIEKINKDKKLVIIDFYPGVNVHEVKEGLINKLEHSLIVRMEDEIFHSNEYVENKINEMMTNDRVFGKMCLHNFTDFIDENKLYKAKKKIMETKGVVIVYGCGASLIGESDIYIYADLARWEIQKRYRTGKLANWKSQNFKEDPLKMFKRGYFFEWRVADRHKKNNFEKFDYILDTNIANTPKMITCEAFLKGLEQTAKRPFRVVPFFDPGVWGGQWMKESCDLDRDVENYAWCFDCVPEENSLLLKVNDNIIEIPSIDVVLRHPKELLGNKVHARFGTEFPIRFDFLDTVGGQNLSLQVHPLLEYAQENFGIHYTQDESYYILDVKEDKDTCVYLGIKTGTDKDEFFDDLRNAAKGEKSFPDEKYINKIKAKKHDHFLIPAGTIHCSGSDVMVLEISATPYIFTFKLWDWDRIGLDGKPRPVHIEHGEKVLQFDRDTEWVRKNLVNKIEVLKEGNGWREERTGLHEREFIETRRHWFSVKVSHNTKNGVNVLNLVEGEQAIVESPNNKFEPFIVSAYETFIIPASVGEYTIKPYGNSEGKEIATIKAYVRN